MAETTAGRAPLPKNTDEPLPNDTPGVEAANLLDPMATPTSGYMPTAYGGNALQPMPGTPGGFWMRWGKQWGSNWVARQLTEQLLCDAKIYQGRNLRKNAVQGRSIRSVGCVPPSDPEFEYATGIADFWNDCRRRIRGSYHSTLWQLQDCDLWGHKIAKIQARVSDSPKYKGLWVPDRLDVWPNVGYEFMQDEYGHFCAVRIQDNGKSRDLDPREFAILTFRPINDNPYGTHLLAALCESFYKSTQASPELIALMTQYGRPGLYVIAPELKEGMPVANIKIFNPDGTPLLDENNNQRELSPLQYNALTMKTYRAGSIVNLSGGSAIGLLQATPGGEALFRFLKEDTDRDKEAVLLGTSQLTNSKGVTSEGNAGTTEEMMRLGILDSRRALEELDEAMCATFVYANYGAKGLQYLPISDIGSMANPRFVSQLNAFGTLVGQGAVDIDQWYWYCASSGLPLPGKGTAKVVVPTQNNGGGGNPNNTN